jgi:hypothetical protein
MNFGSGAEMSQIRTTRANCLMSFDFAALVTAPASEQERLRGQLMTLFEDPQFIFAMIGLLAQDPTGDDRFVCGVLFSIQEMVRLKFGSTDVHPTEFIELFSVHMLDLLFHLKDRHRHLLQSAFRSLIISHWPFSPAAAICMEVLAAPGCDFLPAATAICFVRDFLRVFPEDIGGLDFADMCRLFVGFFRCHMERFGWLDPPMPLRFATTCIRCLARFFSLGKQNSLALLDFVDRNDLEWCVDCAINALESDTGDDWQAMKDRARIAKAFSHSLISLFRPSNAFSLSRELLERLVTISFREIPSLIQCFPRNAFLVLLQSIMTLDAGLCHFISVSDAFTPEFLFAAALLAPTDLDDFVDMPVHYLDGCLVFSRKSMPYSPRSTLLDIFAQMSDEDLVRTAQNIVDLGAPTDPAAQEICLFLMNSLTSLVETSMPEPYVEFALAQLDSGDISPQLAATLLLCLSCVDAPEDAYPRWTALALKYVGSDFLVVRHSALKLLSQNSDPTTWGVEFCCGLIDVLFPLAAEAWHSHLLPLFGALVSSAFPPIVRRADEMFDELWRHWLLSDGDDSVDFTDLLSSVLKNVPLDSPRLEAAALFFGNWFLDTSTSDLPESVVLEMSLVIAGCFPIVPPVFFNALHFWGSQRDPGAAALVEPLSEMCILLIRSYPRLDVGISSVLMLEICKRVLHAPEDDPVRKSPTLFALARMFMILACLVQVRGPEALDLVGIADSFLRVTLPPSPVWSAALIVVLSAIIVSLFVPNHLPQILTQVHLESWYAYGKLPQNLPFSRLSHMSIVAFMVIASVAEGPFRMKACMRAFNQIARMSSVRPDCQPKAWERVRLPFDQMEIPALISNFYVSHLHFVHAILEAEELPGSESDVSLDVVLSLLTPGSAETPVGFFEYIRGFNHWLPAPQ